MHLGHALAVTVDAVAGQVGAHVGAGRDPVGCRIAGVQHLEDRTRAWVALGEDEEVVGQRARQHHEVGLHVARGRARRCCRAARRCGRRPARRRVCCRAPRRWPSHRTPTRSADRRQRVCVDDLRVCLPVGETEGGGQRRCPPTETKPPRPSRSPSLDEQDWKAIESSPEFARLIAERRRVVDPFADRVRALVWRLHRARRLRTTTGWLPRSPPVSVSPTPRR